MESRARLLLYLVVGLVLVSCQRADSTSLTTPDRMNGDSLNPTPQSTQTFANEETMIERIDGIAKGNILVQAIEKYYIAHGHFPELLASLIPDYIEEIPATLSGQDFEYRLSDYYDYILTFNLVEESETNVTKFCGYIRRYQTWECGHNYP